jgi:hypothetical protein
MPQVSYEVRLGDEKVREIARAYWLREKTSTDLGFENDIPRQAVPQIAAPFRDEFLRGVAPSGGTDEDCAPRHREGEGDSNQLTPD